MRIPFSAKTVVMVCFLVATLSTTAKAQMPPDCRFIDQISIQAKRKVAATAKGRTTYMNVLRSRWERRVEAEHGGMFAMFENARFREQGCNMSRRRGYLCWLSAQPCLGRPAT